MAGGAHGGQPRCPGHPYGGFSTLPPGLAGGVSRPLTPPSDRQADSQCAAERLVAASTAPPCRIALCLRATRLRSCMAAAQSHNLSSAMRPISRTLFLLAVASCSPGPSVDTSPGKAELLSGSWDFVVHRAGRPDLIGSVSLAPSLDSDHTVPVALRGGTLEGTFHLRDDAWLTAVPSDSGASAFIGSDSSVVLYLRLQGRCTNCGNLGFGGRLRDSQVTGHWVQEFSSDQPQGSFTLQRAGSR